MSRAWHGRAAAGGWVASDRADCAKRILKRDDFKDPKADDYYDVRVLSNL